MDSWVMCPCQRSRVDLLRRMLVSLEHPSDRVVIIATYPDPITIHDIGEHADHIVVHPFTGHFIAQWWNKGLTYIENAALGHKWEVLSISSDWQGKDYSVAMLGTHLRKYNKAMVGPNPWTPEVKDFYPLSEPHPMNRVPGACWMVAGELGYRVDEQFRWWYSDDDFEMKHRHIGTRIIPDTGLFGDVESELNSEKLLWAVEDRQKYIAKWGREPW